MTTTTHHIDSVVPKVHRLVAVARDELRERRAKRAATRELVRDLRTYTTEREIDDLMATFDRYPNQDVEHLRTVLTRTLMTNRAA